MSTNATSDGASWKPEANRAPGVDCLCLGFGPQLTSVLKSLIPSEGLIDSLRTGELEALKFLRAVIDQRIAGLSGEPGGSKGTRVTVE